MIPSSNIPMNPSGSAATHLYLGDIVLLIGRLQICHPDVGSLDCSCGSSTGDVHVCHKTLGTTAALCPHLIQTNSHAQTQTHSHTTRGGRISQSIPATGASYCQLTLSVWIFSHLASLGWGLKLITLSVKLSFKP